MSSNVNQPTTKFGGAWSDDKLDALGQYLHAYTLALKATSFHLVYIDAFAGAGRDVIEVSGEEEQYRHGSPLIALANDPPFHSFVFIDKNEASIESLKQEVDSSGLLDGRPVKYLVGDANQQIRSLTAEEWKSRRAVVFLDPFALQVRWETLESIAATQAIDMWLLFPAMAVNRMLPRSGIVPEVWAAKLTDTFGSNDWRDHFYSKLGTDLFGEEMIAKASGIFGQLSEYVTKRLKTVFAGVHESPLILKNQSGAPLFLLCFASGNPKGAPIAKRIAQHIINKQSHGR